MKPKLPFTEQFLWDVYNLLEGVSEIGDLFAPRTTREFLCKDIFQLRRNYERYQSRRTFGQTVLYLKRRGYIKQTKVSHGGDALILTTKGADKILEIAPKTESRKERKDGKWIMVMFDIPHEKKFARETFRRRLQALGYKQLQKSVWICRYDTEEETQKIIEQQNLQEFTQLFLINALKSKNRQ